VYCRSSTIGQQVCGGCASEFSIAKPCAANRTVAIRNFNACKIDMLGLMTELFRNVNASSARFFFHSFPRRRQDESRNTQIEKGSRIAKNILDNGLLLAPENYDLPVIGNDGSTADSFTAVQRRICFTELEPEALEGHSQVFGPFALAYRIEDLRRIGALPVSYIPLESGGYLSRLPIEMLGGLIDAHRIAGTLLRVQTQLSQSPALGLKYREKEINFTPEQADVIRKFLNTLIDSAATNLDMTDARLRTMA
jgi:hypothetical protein